MESCIHLTYRKMQLRKRKICLLEDCISQAHVILRCHAKFTEAIPSELKGMIDASMINLEDIYQKEIMQ